MADKLYCWPDWMPKAQSNGYGYEPTDRRTKTDMEVGSVLRVNYDTDETSLDCTLVLNSVQAQWFEKFERDTLNQGAHWFQMPIQIAGCIEWHTVRFTSRPKAGSLIGPYHTTYTLKLDVQQRDLKLCDEVLELFLCVPPQDLLDAVKHSRDFWMGLKTLQKPEWIIAETCTYLYSFLDCVPEETLCVAGNGTASAMQNYIPSINLPSAHEVN